MELTWAGKRRAVVISIFTALLVAVFLILAFSIFYKVPTCSDNKKNQDELEVDCGGSCMTLCSSQVSPVSVQFTRVLYPQPNRIDIVSYIDNPNPDAGVRGARFTLDLYDSTRMRIDTKEVSVDLPPRTTVPVFVPDVSIEGRRVVQAFLTPKEDSFKWSRVTVASKAQVPTVEEVHLTEGAMPRITATLSNTVARTLYSITLVATVFDVEGKAIAASKTLVPTLPAQGTTPLVFTWNAPFESPVGRVEILPMLTLGVAL
jgi:hypothetical protein